MALIAAADALVGQDFGGERTLVRPGGRRAQRGDGGDMRRRSGGLQQFAGVRQCGITPGRGDGIDVEIRLAKIADTLRTQFGQACIDLASDAAEVGVTGVAKAQHGELQLR